MQQKLKYVFTNSFCSYDLKLIIFENVIETCFLKISKKFYLILIFKLT